MSSDNEDDELTYNWEFVEQPPGSSVNGSFTTGPRPSFYGDTPGTYVVSFTVFDGRERSEIDFVQITLEPNTVPIAIIEPLTDDIVYQNRSVTLDGSSSYDANSNDWF